MSKCLWSALILVMAETRLHAQEGPIQADRPDQTETPFTVPQKFIQLETGFLLEKNKNGDQSCTYPSILWKYGFSPRSELRLITEYSSFRNTLIKQSGIPPLTFGLKTRLVDENGCLPAISIIGHISPGAMASKNYKTSYLAPAFRFTLQHTLSEKLSVGYNLGAEWDGETPSPLYIYTFTAGLAAGEKLGLYAELYGFASTDSPPDHRADAGLTYLINQNFMADVSAGLGLGNSQLKNYLSLGFSYRFKL